MASKTIFNAAEINAISGVFTNIPSWLRIKCDSDNRTVRTDATTLELVHRNTFRCISRDGSTKGLLIDKATKNLINEQNMSNWPVQFTPTLSEAETPLRTTEFCDGYDDDTVERELFRLTPGVGISGNHTLSGWIENLDPPEAALMVLLTDAGATAALLSTGAETGWLYKSAVSTSTITSIRLDLRPRSQSTTVGSGRFYGMQVEAGAYPTSFVGADNATFYRHADVLYCPAEVLAPSGYFDITFTYRPHYSESTSSVDHNLIYFDDNNKLVYDKSSAAFIMYVNGDGRASNTVTFSAYQEITIRWVHSASERYMTISGATTGNNTYTDTVQPAMDLPAYCYILGSESGAEESSELVLLETDLDFTDLDPDTVKWHAGYSSDEGGVVEIPGWLHVECETINRTVRTGVSKIKGSLPANAARARSDGSGHGLLLERETINQLADYQDLSALNTVGSLDVTGPVTGPDDELSAYYIEDDDAAESQYIREDNIITYLANTPQSFSMWKLGNGNRDGFQVREVGLITLMGPVYADAGVVDDHYKLLTYTNAFGTGSTGQTAEFYIFPCEPTPVTNVGVVIGSNIQFEVSPYSTSFIAGTRAADICKIPTYCVQSDGFFDITIKYRPHYIHSDNTTAHKIIYINDNFKVEFDYVGTGTFTYTVNSVPITLDDPVTWSQYQELTLRFVYSESERGLVISGATTGNVSNLSAGDTAGDFSDSTFTYLFGDASGVTDSVDLLYFDSGITFTDEDAEEFETPLGAGLASFGTSEVGYGESTLESSVKRTIFKDDFNRQGSVRLIDPTTGDYRFDSQGLIVGGDAIEQMVYLALVTVKGTSAVRDLGQNFSTIRTIPTNFRSIITEEVRKALSNLISRNKIELINVFIDKEPLNPTRLNILVQWKDLEKGVEQASSINI